MYVPNNDAIFVAAYSGAMAGMGVNGGVPLDANSIDYAALATIAGAWAQAFDTSWGANPNSTLDAEMANSLSVEAWSARTPSPQNIVIYANPLNWIAQTNALVAQITAAETYFAAQGISPNPPIAPTTPGNLDVLQFTLALVNKSSITPIPAGAIVLSASLNIQTPYSGGTTISLGRASSPANLQATTDNTPTVAGDYLAQQETSWGGTAAAVLATVAGGPVVGAAVVTVVYGIANP